MKKYNVLLITSDQHRWDAIGAYNGKIKTPNLDRLAKMGMVYDNAYTTNPVCTPSRLSILTGHYPTKHGCYTIGTSLNDDYRTIPQEFSKNGYFTGLLGKAHFQACLNLPFEEKTTFESLPNITDYDFFKTWQGPYFGFDYCKMTIDHGNQKLSASMHYGLWLKEQGVDISKYFGNHRYIDYGTWTLPEEYSNSRWTADETIKAINMAQEEEKPFFLWSSFKDPHNPCFCPEPWASMYDKDDMEIYSLSEEEDFSDKPNFYTNKLNTDEFGDEYDFGGKDWHSIRVLEHMGVEERKDIMTKYYGMISLMDHHIGRILDELEEKNLLDSTIIVFTTDHGDYLGNHNLWYKGIPAYQDVQRLPFIAYHPEVKTPNTHSKAFQSLVDLGQTFMDCADIKAYPGLQGVAQTESWIDNSKQNRDWAMVEFRPSEGSFMQKTFVTENYKFVVYSDMKGELYDLEKDPNQYHNLFYKPEYQELKIRLFQKFVSAEMDKEGILVERTAYA